MADTFARHVSAAGTTAGFAQADGGRRITAVPPNGDWFQGGE